MKHSILTLSLLCLFLLPARSQKPEMQAGIPVNYDESILGDYKATLPDPLVLNNGKKVDTPRKWTRKRRKEIVEIFEQNQFGVWPARKPPLNYSLKKDEGLGGAAVRKQLTLYFSPTGEDGPKVDVVIYLPKNAQGKSPVLLSLSFQPNSASIYDPGLKQGMVWNNQTRERVLTDRVPKSGPNEMDSIIKRYLEAGYGFASLCYTDITPDFEDSDELGVRGLYHTPGAPRAADDWGSIGCWAWGISNVVDYLVTDPDIDPGRIALVGCSRLGKTALWAGAKEPRFAVVIASCSGEGGAALSRRVYGETVAHLTTESRFPYQFCPTYATWANRLDEMPMDSHMLISLIAPRPLLLLTAEQDGWSDPKGEFEAAVKAGPVWELFGKKSLEIYQMPPVGVEVYNTLGFVMREGGHGTIPMDWDYYLDYLKKYL